MPRRERKSEKEIERYEEDTEGWGDARMKALSEIRAQRHNRILDI